QVSAPDAPEAPLSDRHDTLVHVRGPYGDKGRRSIEWPIEPIPKGERKVNSAQTRDAPGRTRKGCRNCHQAAITLMRRGYSELSEHCPQAVSSCLGDDGRRFPRRVAVDDGSDERGCDDIHHVARTRAESVTDQRHQVASQPGG